MTANGGDVEYTNNDLAIVDGFENMPLLAMFGGNVEADTKAARLATEEDLSWWGNKVIWPNDPDRWFNSKTERLLRQLSLTSANLQNIINAVEQDLAFMRAFAEFTVSVSYPQIDRVRIALEFTRPTNLQQRQFVYIWDATQQSLFSYPVANPTQRQRPALQQVLQSNL